MPLDGLRVEAGEARDAVVLVHDVVARAQVGEAAQQAAAPARRARRCLAPVDQPVLGDHGELQAGGDEAVAQVGLLEDEAFPRPVPARLDPREVVGGALAAAAVRPGDERRVAGAAELLQLGLCLAQRARGELGGLRAELERLGARDRGEPQRPPRLERGEDAVGLDVQVMRVAVVERGADVVPVVAQRRLDVLLGREHELGLVRDQVEQVAEVVDGQQLGDVRALVGALERRDLCELAVLGGELGRGRDLDHLGRAERALREGGEPAQRLDLVVEQVDADRPLLGRRVDVEQPAADRELATVLDLVRALVAGGDEVRRALVEVEQLADPEGEAVRAQRRIRDLLRQGDRGHHDDRGLGPGAAIEERVQRGDAQADEVSRRRQVRFVGDAAAGIEAHRARPQPRAQVGREVARGPVVARDDHGGPARVAIGDRRDQVRAQRLRDERVRARLRQPGGVRVALEMGEKGA